MTLSWSTLGSASRRIAVGLGAALVTACGQPAAEPSVARSFPAPDPCAAMAMQSWRPALQAIDPAPPQKTVPLAELIALPVHVRSSAKPMDLGELRSVVPPPLSDVVISSGAPTNMGKIDISSIPLEPLLAPALTGTVREAFDDYTRTHAAWVSGFPSPTRDACLVVHRTASQDLQSFLEDHARLGAASPAELVMLALLYAKAPEGRALALSTAERARALVSERHPVGFAVRFALGQLREEANDFEGARRAFEEATRATSVPPLFLANAFYRLADLHNESTIASAALLARATDLAPTAIVGQMARLRRIQVLSEGKRWAAVIAGALEVLRDPSMRATDIDDFVARSIADAVVASPDWRSLALPEAPLWVFREVAVGIAVDALNESNVSLARRALGLVGQYAGQAEELRARADVAQHMKNAASQATLEGADSQPMTRVRALLARCLEEPYPPMSLFWSTGGPQGSELIVKETGAEPGQAQCLRAWSARTLWDAPSLRLRIQRVHRN